MNYNPFSLEGKTIFITGASSGIGRSCAIECSRMGAKLVITGRNEERLNETFSLCEGKDNKAIIANLQNKDDQLKLLDNLPDKLDGIVQCAGISSHKVFQFLKEDEIRDMFDINFFIPLYLSKKLINQKKIRKGGSIVFITSTSGILSSYIGGSLYSSTKGALNGLIKGMAIELAQKKIRINSVMPSMISTPIMQDGLISEEQFQLDMANYPLKRYGKPEEVAWGVIYLLSDASQWVTGSNLLIDGGRSIVY